MSSISWGVGAECHLTPWTGSMWLNLVMVELATWYVKAKSDEYTGNVRGSVGGRDAELETSAELRSLSSALARKLHFELFAAQRRHLEK